MMEDSTPPTEAASLRARLAALGFQAADDELAAIARELEGFEARVEALRALVTDDLAPSTVFRADWPESI
jgi:hypothetical protein